MDYIGKSYKYKINNFLWDCTCRPEAEAALSVSADGIRVHMVCYEVNPRCTYVSDNDPVFRDSAMEFFMTIMPDKLSADISLSDYKNVRYMNLEANANGALLSHFGTKGHANRKSICELSSHMPLCSAKQSDECWQLDLFIPLTLLSELYGIISMDDINAIACNFYKISETESIKHFAAAFPIDTPTPDFHRPDFFKTLPF